MVAKRNHNTIDALSSRIDKVTVGIEAKVDCEDCIPEPLHLRFAKMALTEVSWALGVFRPNGRRHDVKREPTPSLGVCCPLVG